jgi:hypothetical protein
MRAISWQTRNSMRHQTELFNTLFFLLLLITDICLISSSLLCFQKKRNCCQHTKKKRNSKVKTRRGRKARRHIIVVKRFPYITQRLHKIYMANKWKRSVKTYPSKCRTTLMFGIAFLCVIVNCKFAISTCN